MPKPDTPTQNNLYVSVSKKSKKGKSCIIATLERTYVPVSARKTGGFKMIYLHKYQTFKNVSELNHHVKQHTKFNYHNMNETQRQVLQFIAQHSVKYAGASHLRIQTIADAIGKSRRTVERAINALIELKIIERINTTRPVSGGKGANIYRILPFDVSDMSHSTKDAKPTDTTVNEHIVSEETVNLLNSNNITSNTYLETSYSIPYRKIRKAVITFMGNHNSVNKLIYRLYGVFVAQTKPLRLAYSMDELISAGIRAIHATFHATKRKQIRNLAGYFNGVLNNMLDDLYFATTAEYWAPDKISVEQSLILRSF